MKACNWASNGHCPNRLSFPFNWSVGSLPSLHNLIGPNLARCVTSCEDMIKSRSHEFEIVVGLVFAPYAEPLSAARMTRQASNCISSFEGSFPFLSRKHSM